MNKQKSIKFIFAYSIDVIRCKIKHICETLDFQKNVEMEQKKRHEEYKKYCEKYLECLEKSRMESKST